MHAGAAHGPSVSVNAKPHPGILCRDIHSSLQRSFVEQLLSEQSKLHLAPHLDQLVVNGGIVTDVGSTIGIGNNSPDFAVWVPSKQVPHVQSRLVELVVANVLASLPAFELTNYDFFL